MNKDKMLEELSVLQERFANGMGWRDGEYEEALDEAIELINKMSSADVVEIVRCKDCKHCEHSDFPSMDYCFRKEPYIFEVDAEFYCKGGERKETNV